MFKYPVPDIEGDLRSIDMNIQYPKSFFEEIALPNSRQNEVYVNSYQPFEFTFIHPEQEVNEIYLTNLFSLQNVTEEFRNIPFKSKRLVVNGYDKFGKRLVNSYAVFVDREEYRQYEIEQNKGFL
jgi:hypothetical protein